MADYAFTLEDEDWPKRTWDIRLVDGTLVTTLAELRYVLGWSDPQLVHMLELPVGAGMPEGLKAELVSLRDAR